MLSLQANCYGALDYEAIHAESISELTCLGSENVRWKVPEGKCMRFVYSTLSSVERCSLCQVDTVGLGTGQSVQAESTCGHYFISERPRAQKWQCR